MEVVGPAFTSVFRRPRVLVRIGRPIEPTEYAGRTLHESVTLVHERVTAVWRSLAA